MGLTVGFPKEKGRGVQRKVILSATAAWMAVLLLAGCGSDSVTDSSVENREGEDGFVLTEEGQDESEEAGQKGEAEEAGQKAEAKTGQIGETEHRRRQHANMAIM